MNDAETLLLSIDGPASFPALEITSRRLKVGMLAFTNRIHFSITTVPVSLSIQYPCMGGGVLRQLYFIFVLS